METTRKDGYTGFLLIRCEHCGKVRGFCTRKPIQQSWCHCGSYTDLKNLIPAYLNCGKCGRNHKYKTNITDATFDFPCLHCGSPVDMELKKNGTAYVAITE